MRQWHLPEADRTLGTKCLVAFASLPLSLARRILDSFIGHLSSAQLGPSGPMQADGISHPHSTPVTVVQTQHTTPKADRRDTFI